MKAKSFKLSDCKKCNDNNLIILGINKARCDGYYWNWSSDLKDWVRGEKIDDVMLKKYKTPLVRSNYK